MAKSDKWVERWPVIGSTGKTYIVGLDKDGNYGCSCPVWKFQRKQCKHISEVKTRESLSVPSRIVKPQYVLAMVRKPTYLPDTNELRIPLISLPDTIMMEATICFYLIRYGYTMSEIREMRRIPSSWTASAIIDQVERYGEACYPEKATTAREKDGVEVADPAKAKMLADIERYGIRRVRI